MLLVVDVGFVVSACCLLFQVEVQSLLLAEVVGGAQTTALKSTQKNIYQLWKQVSKGLQFLSEIRVSVLIPAIANMSIPVGSGLEQDV